MTTKRYELIKITGYNAGQNIEASVRKAEGYDSIKADNIRHEIDGDITINGIRYQIKSSHATLSNTLDVNAYLTEDAADCYIYVTKNGTAFFMDKEEFTAFLNRFSVIELNVKENINKLRIRQESSKMIAWLQEYNQFGKVEW